MPKLIAYIFANFLLSTLRTENLLYIRLVFIRFLFLVRHWIWFYFSIFNLELDLGFFFFGEKGIGFGFVCSILRRCMFLAVYNISREKVTMDTYSVNKIMESEN